jgi:hypothetical protein
MTPPPDKIRPWITRRCSEPECEFESKAEFEWLRHEAETGHSMEPFTVSLPPARLRPGRWA